MRWFNEFDILIEYIGMFVFWYPFLMSLFWIAGALMFYLFRERNYENDFTEYNWPKISILVPCYNEEETIEETVDCLSQLSYPEFEIIAVNDGSNDSTGEILMELVEEYSMLRVINCHENRGKANALHMAAHASTSEYLICIDSDAILSDEAPYYLIHHFLKKGERLGAVTGNPRIRNRDTLLSKMQIVEYSSIIGSIKRTQRIIGKVMTVSGVIVAFRKKALMDVGLWDRDMITEDIAVSWKLQKRFWDIRYEPRALCWMLVPETISGIWKQRVRWAQGSQEVLIRHWDIFTDWRQRRIWIIYIEQIISIIWAIAWILVTLYLIFTANSINELFIWATFNSFALIMLSHIQLIISLWNDSRYDDIKKYYLWASWYPAIYWVLNTFVVVSAIPKAISSRIRGGYATWSSPDRGNRRSL
ncbi:poly-beta-1,6-N-acetyl-D-glucosamine synthase [[Clostridium] dakarense]|uniref:poly-beta-1,6-N-acetyl-D-glucosamine synthase n=1 Tax=Faecalimicrobium dakarense TaxID=1301100 RepID=UPI0004BA2D2A|nr:poly-beta-1,6-N-acetyl-D-glucosamine synthase [[Clostridium] dakarense]